MKVVSVINYKGGVGKTTITANIAAELAQKRMRVLAIDLDPQTNLTFSFMGVDEWKDNYEKDKTIKYWFDSLIDKKPNRPTFNDIIVPKNGLSMICSHLALIDVDIELAAGLSAATQRQHKTNFLRTYSYIKQELDSLQNDYDVVLFDCPPNFSIVTKNALVASDFYIVPAKMDYLSTLGITQLDSNVKKLVSEYNEYIQESDDFSPIDPQFLGVIATMISVRNDAPISAQQYHVNVLKQNKIDLFDTMIRENKTLFADGPEYGTPVVLQHHTPCTTYGNVVNELKSLALEFKNKVGI